MISKNIMTLNCICNNLTEKTYYVGMYWDIEWDTFPFEHQIVPKPRH